MATAMATNWTMINSNTMFPDFPRCIRLKIFPAESFRKADSAIAIAP